MNPFTCPNCKRSFLVSDGPDGGGECPACHKVVGRRHAPAAEGLRDLVRLKQQLARRVRQREAALGPRPDRREGPAPLPRRSAEPWFYRGAEWASRGLIALGTLACLTGLIFGAGGQGALYFLAGAAVFGAALSWACLVLILTDLAREVRRSRQR